MEINSYLTFEIKLDPPQGVLLLEALKNYKTSDSSVRNSLDRFKSAATEGWLLVAQNTTRYNIFVELLHDLSTKDPVFKEMAVVMDLETQTRVK